MNRRSFLKVLLGTTALVVLPVAAAVKPATEVVTFTVNYYVVPEGAAAFKMYKTFEKGLEVIAPDIYSFKLNTQELTK